MSANRLSYDECSYKHALKQSTSQIDYTLDPIAYEHSEKCRMEFGLVGGNNVSQIKGNLVDLENELRGQRHPMTKCSQYKYTPPEDNTLSSCEYIKPVNHPDININMNHLDTCQMIDYAPVPNTSNLSYDRCE